MSARSYNSFCTLALVGLMVAAGCSSGNTEARSKSRDYDMSALDNYMSDANDSEDRKANRALLRPDGSKPSSNEPKPATWSDNYDYDDGHVEYDSFAGEWAATLEMDDSGQSSGDPQMDEMANAMASAFSDMFSMSLNLEEDGKFDMVMVMMPIEGNWELKGNSLFLTPVKVMGFTEDEIGKLADQMADSYESTGVEMTMESDSFEPLELRIAERGMLLVAQDPESGGSQPMAFRRK